MTRSDNNCTHFAATLATTTTNCALIAFVLVAMISVDGGWNASSYGVHEAGRQLPRTAPASCTPNRFIQSYFMEPLPFGSVN